jgi:hypothetical protein
MFENDVARSKPPITGESITVKEMLRERTRAARLQEIVDGLGEREIGQIRIHTAADAVEIRDKYDLDWFKRCIYSSDVKRKLAQRLLDETHSYSSMIDTTVWEAVVRETAQ